MKTQPGICSAAVLKNKKCPGKTILNNTRNMGDLHQKGVTCINIKK